MYSFFTTSLTILIGILTFTVAKYAYGSTLALLLYLLGIYVLLGIFFITSYGIYMKFKSKKLISQKNKNKLSYDTAMNEIYRMDKMFEVICVIFAISSIMLVLIGILDEVIAKK